MKMIKATLTFIPTTGDALSNALRKAAVAAGKTLLLVSLCLAGLGLAAVSSFAAGANLKTLSGHVPQVLSQLQPLGLLPATNTLQLAIGLPLRNREELTNLLEQMYDPASTNYHQYLTPEEFTAQFGPTEQDYQAVIDFAKANGLVVTATHPNRVVLSVSGMAGNIGKAFHVKLRTYQHPTENRSFYAPDAEPSVDANLPVLCAQGLNNYQLPQPMLKKMSAAGASPANGSGPGGGYIGQDFRNAYAPGAALNGSGQVVGLLQFDGYFASDIANYMSLAGMTNVPLQNVLLDGFNGTPGINNGEVCLDIETCVSMAPALAKVVVFEAGPFGNPDDILSSMVSSNKIKQFSASWGYDVDATTEQLYQQLALQGQTFFNASGDGDAWVNSTWPVLYSCLDDPYITIVGGTTLTMNGVAQSYASEKVWNWGFNYNYGWNPDGYAGSSGGISATRSIPSWQTNINFSASHGSSTMRNVPDVALTGDNVYVAYGGGTNGLFGGTSCASPLWAGFMALVNQQAAANGVASPGFLNPALYNIAAGANYTNCFHDITTGNNAWPLSGGLYNAVAGYDLCTGLGTPNGINLINALASGSFTNPITHLSPPPPPYGSTLSALNGGNPNGTWQLFVQDDVRLDSGTNYNGWYLTLTMANPLGAVCDLALTMTAFPSNTVVVGNNLVYSIGVTNYGVSTATNAVVSFTLQSSGITLVSSSCTQGSVSGLSWNIGSLPSGAGAQCMLTVQPTAAGVINNYAIASSATPDPNSADNSALVSVTATATSAPPQIGGFGKTNGNFSLTITAPSVPTIVQVSTNIATTNWLNVYTSTPPFTFTETNATNPARFYRALLAP